MIIRVLTLDSINWKAAAWLNLMPWMIPCWTPLLPEMKPNLPNACRMWSVL